MAEKSDLRARAYMARSTAAFMGEKFGSRKADEILAGLSPATRAAATELKPADWFSVDVYAELLNALAAQSNGNADDARETLIACGEYVAREASNTFLKMLMRILTPSLFASKLPALWRRDFSGGKLEADIQHDRLVCRMFEIKGFDHAPCTAAGFVKFALSSMGKVVENVQVHNWSLSDPCAEGASIELVWQR
jgi:hypothetical protein